jgi:hypothetical protein
LNNTMRPRARSAFVLQLFEAAHDDDFGLNPLGGRSGPDAVSESEHDHRVPRRLDYLGALGAAHPFRHHDAFGVHILETVPFHLIERPGDGAIERRCAA